MRISSVRLFMRLIHGSFAGLVLAGILAIAPTAAFAHDGWHGSHYVTTGTEVATGAGTDIPIGMIIRTTVIKTGLGPFGSGGIPG